MSDPVSKMEDVEDVLSSIRRLVADTSGGAPREHDAETEPEPPQEALILTSAQRVNPDKGAPHPPVSSLDALRKAVAEPDSVSEKMMAGGWVRPTPDDYYEDEAEVTPTGWAEAQAQFDGLSADLSVQVDRPAFAPLPDDGTAEDEDAELDDGEIVYDESEDTKPTEAEIVDDIAWQTEENQILSPVDDVQPSLVEELGVATFRRAGGDAGTEDQVEEARYVHVEIDPEGREITVEDTDVEPDSPPFEPGMIDEDRLRELVGEMVRQELGGEMGERITRNVRKLVRREIHRALEAREFE